MRPTVSTIATGRRRIADDDENRDGPRNSLKTVIEVRRCEVEAISTKTSTDCSVNTNILRACNLQIFWIPPASVIDEPNLLTFRQSTCWLLRSLSETLSQPTHPEDL